MVKTSERLNNIPPYLFVEIDKKVAAAKAKGVRFGRPPKPLPDNFHEEYQRWKQGEITGTAAAKECGMPLSTFRYRAEIYENAKLL